MCSREGMWLVARLCCSAMKLTQATISLGLCIEMVTEGLPHKAKTNMKKVLKRPSLASSWQPQLLKVFLLSRTVKCHSSLLTFWFHFLIFMMACDIITLFFKLPGFPPGALKTRSTDSRVLLCFKRNISWPGRELSQDYMRRRWRQVMSQILKMFGMILKQHCHLWMQ